MPMTTKTLRATLGALALASLSLLAAPASAAPPAPVQTQVPGYYRQALGEFEITALYDGYVDLAPQLLKGLRADQVQSLLARMFIANTKGVQTAVNGYLVHTGDHLVLVDAGAAQCFGPTLGQINSNLKAAGYSADAVDVVLLTHLHPDHLCGLVDGQGKAAFPNATVYAAKADADFWLSAKAADAAPDGFKPFFKMAGDSVAPYQAGGRFKTYTPGETLIPGVEALDTSGHTPGHRRPRLIRTADAKTALHPRALVTQPVLESLIDDVDAFKELAPGLQRLGRGVAVLFKVSGNAGQPDRVAVGFKPLRLAVQRLADLHQRLPQAAACLLRPAVRPQPRFQPAARAAAVRGLAQHGKNGPCLRPARRAIPPVVVAHLKDAHKAYEHSDPRTT